MPSKKKSGTGHGSHLRRAGGTNTRETRANGQKQLHAKTFTRAAGGHRRTAGNSIEKQLFDYMIVVDFECTCRENCDDFPNEIIEFPAILVDIRNGGKVLKEKSFRSYAKPWRNPVLSDFCTSLTGIQQIHVQNAPDLQDVVRNFEQWYRRVIPIGAKVMLATDGPWDFKNFVLKGAVKRDHVMFPTLFYEYFDIRTTFANFFNNGKSIKLNNMLSRLGLKFEGRPHCGFDDAVNIARLAVAMMKEGCIFSYLVALPLDEDAFHYQMDITPLYRRKEGRSGLINRDHVEERCKEAFGEAYYAYGGSVFGRLGNDESEADDDESFIEDPDTIPDIDLEAEIGKLAVVSPDTSDDESVTVEIREQRKEERVKLIVEFLKDSDIYAMMTKEKALQKGSEEGTSHPADEPHDINSMTDIAHNTENNNNVDSDTNTKGTSIMTPEDTALYEKCKKILIEKELLELKRRRKESRKQRLDNRSKTIESLRETKEALNYRRNIAVKKLAEAQLRDTKYILPKSIRRFMKSTRKYWMTVMLLVFPFLCIFVKIVLGGRQAEIDAMIDGNK
eukprot:Tbor_TRINITY_DN1929_c0_g1::TRINITY_DN1929_c0_g1_i1::g.3513::m.3513/K18416/THEX1, ERI1; 3'-5' exoribonuclease 1